MHILQPKHVRLKPEERKKILDKYNLSVSQLPRIKLDDPALPKDCAKGDVVKIERKDGDKIYFYFRVIV